ncbi:hypothetical protein BT63DRAFT_460944 [Microthyrium microscopicum]|uniref:Uncharacterized protein n=1 Tax=Microthyrium microscopicum TaxID=703497 RepID=A0A6A6TVH2_9PEZI|nr:hypothetical protein BT63DRAFT_460944 [Microthyrium microscopicum]
MAKDDTPVSAALVTLTRDDNKYTMTQVPMTCYDAPADGKNTMEIDWASGPVMLSGYLDTDDFGITLKLVVNGMSTGKLTGNMKDGLWVYVNTFTTKGSTALYLKNGSEL